MMWRFVLCWLCSWIAGVAQAADISVPARPGAVSALFESGGIRSGDILRLAAGHHGEIRLRGVKFAHAVTIRPEGGPVTLSGLRLREMAGLAFVGFNIRPDGSDDGPMVRVRESTDIVLEELDVASGEGFESWSAETWLGVARTGIRVEGTDIVLRDNRIAAVRYGIEAIGRGITVERNEVSWFSGDRIRALADDSVYTGNTIDTCVKVDDHHDDGIQSWSVDADGRPGWGVVRNVRIEANTIRNGQAGRGLTCELQGIGFLTGCLRT